MSNKLKVINIMIGARYECQCCGRIARIIGKYRDNELDNGYEYIFEEEEPYERWISAHDAKIRFHRIGDDKATVKAKLEASNESK